MHDRKNFGKESFSLNLKAKKSHKCFCLTHSSELRQNKIEMATFPVSFPHLRFKIVKNRDSG